MSNQPSTQPPLFDQRGQHVHNQINVAGNLNIVATSVTFLAFALLLIELATNAVERLSGLNLQSLLAIAGLIGALAWALAFIVLRKQRAIGQSIGYQESDLSRPGYNQVAAFDGRYRRFARITLWTIPTLVAIVAIAYYTWRVLPARYTTILLADFVAPSGTDEALVTQTLAITLDQTLAAFPTLRVKRLHQVIDPDGGSEEARRLGTLPQHKATIVIWGNYPFVAYYVYVNLHFDIVQPADTYLETGFATSYGPGQISQLLQIKQPTMFDFKLSLGQYLGQMSAFTVGLTLFNTYRHNDAIAFFETAGQAIDQPLAIDFARAIRFYRGTNYLSLDRTKDAQPDLAALAPALETNPVTLDSFGLASLGNLGIVALKQSEYAVAKHYLEQALKLYTQLSNPLGQANQLGNLGVVTFQQGDYGAAERYYQQALTLYTQLANSLGQATSLSNLGLVALEQGEYEAAKHYHQQALHLDTQLGNSLGQAQDLGNLGLVALEQGEYEAAKHYHQQALHLDTQLGNSLGQAQNLGNLGLVAFQQGDYVTAKRYHQQALHLDTQLGHPLGQAANLGNLGLVAFQRGDYVTAKRYHQQALDLYIQSDHPLGQAAALGNLGLVAFRQDDYTAAKRYLEQALELYTHLGNPLGQAHQLGNLGLVAFAQGDYAEAKRYHEQALNLDTQLGNPLGQAANLGNLGNMAKYQGDYAAAKHYYEQALHLDTRLGNPLGQAVALANLGLVARDQGDPTSARNYFTRSAALYQSMGIPIPPALQAGLDTIESQ